VTLHWCKSDDHLFHTFPKAKKQLSNAIKKSSKKLEEEKKNRFFCKACVQLKGKEVKVEDTDIFGVSH
jgi:hypothetical protein